MAGTPEFNVPLRLPADGPDIGNAEGGTASPGPGFAMRMVENAEGASVALVALTYAAVGTPLELALPDPNRRYRFEASVSLTAGATSAGSCKLKGQVSYDGGANWFDLPQAVTDELLPANGVSTLHYVQPGILASSLPSWPAVTPATLQFRCLVQVTDATTATLNQNGGGGQPVKTKATEQL